MKVNISMDVSTVRVTFLGVVVQAILASFIIMTSKVRVYINGPTGDSTKANGMLTKCMAMASSNGKMVDIIKVAS